MPEKRLNKIIRELPFAKKMVTVGAVTALISVFLPWYRDLDAFRTGDVFLGITGPLYIAGGSIFAIALFNLIIVLADGAGKKIPLPSGIRSSTISLISGIAVFYLLLIVNSVYFHPKFGLNLTLKESQIGMFLALLSAALMTFGGYFSGREKAALIAEFQEITRPIVNADRDAVSRKPKENLRNMAKTETSEMAKQIQIETPETTPVIDLKNEVNKSYQPFRTDL